MTNPKASGRGLLSLAPFTVGVIFLYWLLIWVAHLAVAPRVKGLSANHYLGQTPMFRLLYEGVVRAGEVNAPLIILVIIAPVLAMASFAVWALFSARGQAPATPTGSAHFMARMQFSIILTLVLSEYFLGLPVGSFVLGAENVYSMFGVAAHGSCVIILLHLSALVSPLGIAAVEGAH